MAGYPKIVFPKYLCDFYAGETSYYEGVYERLKRRLGQHGGISLELLRPLHNKEVIVHARDDWWASDGLRYVHCEGVFSGYLPVEFIRFSDEE